MVRTIGSSLETVLNLNTVYNCSHWTCK